MDCFPLRGNIQSVFPFGQNGTRLIYFIPMQTVFLDVRSRLSSVGLPAIINPLRQIFLNSGQRRGRLLFPSFGSREVVYRKYEWKFRSDPD